jgi:hypothetical protein
MRYLKSIDGSAVAFGTFASSLVAADVSTAEKARYSFFNRTPESMLRDLSTDRPDLTESPYTVDAGWWQLEMDSVAYTRDHDTSDGADVRTTALAFPTLNLKAGLTHFMDLQTVIAPHTRVRTHDRIAGTRERVSGFGDITSRLKINLWGNDGGSSALAVMPFVTWPTGRRGLSSESVEGGLIVPLALELPRGFGLGLMTEIDVVRNDSDTGHDTEWLNSVTLARDIVGSLGGFIELTHLSRRGRDAATFDCGLTYGVGRHVQFDVGCNVGLTRATEDLTVFTGLAVRF